MNTTVEDYTFDYSLNADVGTAVLLLPESLGGTDETVRYADTTVSVLKKLSSSGVEATLGIGELSGLALVHNRALEWVAPTILFTYAAISENPNIVSIVLNVISSYLYEIFRGRSDEPTANCKFVYRGRKNSLCKKVVYKGPKEGLKAVEGIIRELHAGADNNP